MRIVFIHGMATSGGAFYAWGRRFLHNGFDCRFYVYERRHFWSYWNEDNIIADAASFIHSDAYTENCHIICHSMGQILVQKAAELGAVFDSVTIYSGAGTSDKFVWPKESMRKCYWMVNVSDLAVWAGALLPNHPFGKAARRGYCGEIDDRHVNFKYDRDKLFNIDHSFWFTEWGDYTYNKQCNLLSPRNPLNAEF